MLLPKWRSSKSLNPNRTLSGRDCFPPARMIALRNSWHSSINPLERRTQRDWDHLVGYHVGQTLSVL